MSVTSWTKFIERLEILSKVGICFEQFVEFSTLSMLNSAMKKVHFHLNTSLLSLNMLVSQQAHSVEST